jgi:hypothetical protein
LFAGDVTGRRQAVLLRWNRRIHHLTLYSIQMLATAAILI